MSKKLPDVNLALKKEPFYPNQIVPLSLTSVVFLVGVGILLIEILLLNKFALAREKILPVLRVQDILIGVTIYLKTSIDFAIFIGRLMAKFPGWKNRIMIEIGTALGNIAGTLAILILWDVFREIRALMAIMIVVAALVLLRMAEEGLDHVKDEEGKYKVSFGGVESFFEKILHTFNQAVAPVLNKVIPRTDMKEIKAVGFVGLFVTAFTIPFILGLDDFAGYIPLFNIVNVFGFGTGVFLGHMILNIALFLSPDTTIKVVKHPVISFFGSLAFVGLALWGLWEAAALIGLTAHH
jgi:hypothetical protein